MFKLNGEAERLRDIMENNKEKGHLKAVSELISKAKRMRVKFYVCSTMGLLNIRRDELIEKIDKEMGLATFLGKKQIIDSYLSNERRRCVMRIRGKIT